MTEAPANSIASSDDVADGGAKERCIGMFSYGSNNERQLRARVKSPHLRGSPAYVDGYVRVFGFSAPYWGGGSVASVARKEGGRVYGCFYLMTPEEMAILDLYEHVKEGGYLKEEVMVNVRAATGSGSSSSDGNRYENGDNPGSGDSSGGSRDVSASATVYVMAQRYVQTFVDPSPQYLTAVYRTLTRNFPELSGRPLEICDYTGIKRSEWVYPGARGLPLIAFLLEVGLEEEPPWVFPLVLGPIVARLEAVGIATTDALCEAATGGVLLSKLASASGRTVGGAQGERDGVQAESALSQTESGKLLLSSLTVPEFTVETVGIIARIDSVAAAAVAGGEGAEVVSAS